MKLGRVFVWSVFLFFRPLLAESESSLFSLDSLLKQFDRAKESVISYDVFSKFNSRALNHYIDGLEAAYIFFRHPDVQTDVSFFKKRGDVFFNVSNNFELKYKMSSRPLDADFYFSFGALYKNFEREDRLFCFKEHSRKSEIGAVAKAGILYKISPQISFEGFGGYINQNVSFSQSQVVCPAQGSFDLSGVKVHIGITISF